MEFKKERVYSAVNADELKPGDKVIVADRLSDLKILIQENAISTLKKVKGENKGYRFDVGVGIPYALAYLVKRKENCANCSHSCKSINPCLHYEPKTDTPELISLGNGQYVERKHYRPFKDTDELVKVWCEYKCPAHNHRERGLTMPFIWVRRKECNCKGQLITKFSDPLWVIMSTEAYNMTALFEHFTFLDGSPCGVEE